jgi:hypothetical protein
MPGPETGEGVVLSLGANPFMGLVNYNPPADFPRRQQE